MLNIKTDLGKEQESEMDYEISENVSSGLLGLLLYFEMELSTLLFLITEEKMICQKAVSRSGFRLVPKRQFFSKSWAANSVDNIHTETILWVKPELQCECACCSISDNLLLYLSVLSGITKQRRCQWKRITIKSANEIYNFRNEWMSSFASKAKLTGNVMPTTAKSNVQESCSGLILAVKCLSKLTGPLTTL